MIGDSKLPLGVNVCMSGVYASSAVFSIALGCEAQLSFTSKTIKLLISH